MIVCLAVNSPCPLNKVWVMLRLPQRGMGPEQWSALTFVRSFSTLNKPSKSCRGKKKQTKKTRLCYLTACFCSRVVMLHKCPLEQTTWQKSEMLWCRSALCGGFKVRTASHSCPESWEWHHLLSHNHGCTFLFFFFFLHLWQSLWLSAETVSPMAESGALAQIIGHVFVPHQPIPNSWPMIVRSQDFVITSSCCSCNLK